MDARAAIVTAMVWRDAPPMCCRNASLASSLCSIATLSMRSRCCSDANRCARASLAPRFAHRVARCARGSMPQVRCNAAIERAADCVTHAEDVQRGQSHAHSRTRLRTSRCAPRAAVHRPQSLCPCGFAQVEVRRDATFARACDAHHATCNRVSHGCVKAACVDGVKGFATRVRDRETRTAACVRALHRDAIGNVFVTTRVRTSWSDACRQVFLHFFLNIIVQTNYDSP